MRQPKLLKKVEKLLSNVFCPDLMGWCFLMIPDLNSENKKREKTLARSRKNSCRAKHTFLPFF
jgi:hypothetical protein